MEKDRKAGKKETLTAVEVTCTHEDVAKSITVIMQGGLHVLLENLINSTYQYHRDRLSKLGIHGKIHAFATSYITFGGWEPSCDGAG
ncbi:4903_t:CDS:2 [Racocetra fulgida]|uniref:4903_t:CDS:1 n=1 Tax=Racocetra fulgida TaxID=60492 RepID=A0A9N8WK99_9GLOM|nr:4903_t:CDS:2 [Racocetra fulgida]